MEVILTTIINESDFECLKEHSESSLWDEIDRYDNFIAWNKECLDKLPDFEISWIIYLCNKIKRREIHHANDDDFFDRKSFAIYFNHNRELVIVHPE